MKKILALVLLVVSLSSYGATSQEERAKQKVEVTSHLGINYRMASIGLGASYFLDADNLIGLKAGSGNDEGGDLKETYFALQYKHYFGNTFYITGETFYLNSREDVNGFWGDIFYWENNADYISLGAEVRIGNQWTWKNFTMGCDWVGLGHRFVTFKKESDNVEEITLSLVNFTIGASF
jgi:hypothetical protein